MLQGANQDLVVLQKAAQVTKQETVEGLQEGFRVKMDNIITSYEAKWDKLNQTNLLLMAQVNRGGEQGGNDKYIQLDNQYS